MHQPKNSQKRGCSRHHQVRLHHLPAKFGEIACRLDGVDGKFDAVGGNDCGVSWERFYKEGNTRAASVCAQADLDVWKRVFQQLQERHTQSIGQTDYRPHLSPQRNMEHAWHSKHFPALYESSRDERALVCCTAVWLYLFNRMVNLDRENTFPVEYQSLLQWILPTLIHLLKEENDRMKTQAAGILASLLQDRPVFQKMAADAGALKTLWQIINEFEEKEEEVKAKQVQAMEVNELQMNSRISLVYNALQSIVFLTASNEEIRKSMIEKNEHKLLLKLIECPEQKIKIAACNCIIHLARAEVFLKGQLVGAGVIEALTELLAGTNEELQVLALSALSNLALEYQEDICKNERCFIYIINLAKSKNSTLRYRSIFAIKNLLFKPNENLKKRVLAGLGFEKLIELFNDEDQQIQIQAICTMRCMMHEKNSWVVEAIDKFGPESFLSIAGQKVSRETQNLLCQTLYMLCNMATLNERYKTLVSTTAQITDSMNWLDSVGDPAKLAIMNFIINIFWTPKDSRKEREEKRNLLGKLGVEAKLSELARSGSGEVALRAAQTLAYFS
eukprot:TRINITY_DN16224_c0_g1_i11.p1 TRINITY_DN16224_c0_g1~~TRINITY_DN16224_c0_g1_i11.p1  ORF type:complete len:560 (-),score=70.98 TRINITY_DN16224_c0_g1_i11:115-1794(-)